MPARDVRDARRLDVDSEEVQDSIRHIVAHGVPLTSTLSVFEWRIPGRPPVHPRALEMMTPQLREEYEELYERTRQTADERAFMTGLLTNAMAFNRAFVDAGACWRAALIRQVALCRASAIIATTSSSSNPAFGRRRPSRS